MKKVQGFTLIELMIVIAILGILMAIAIPAYQDYTVRAKVSECVNAVAPAKLGISEFVISNARWPANVASFGTLFSTEFCNVPTYANTGMLTINPNQTGVGAPVAITIQLSPTTDPGGNVIWECNATAGSQYAPATCR